MKVGDRVRCISNCHLKNMCGVIVEMREDGLIGVCWDKAIVGGHTCESKCLNGYGYYVRLSDITKKWEHPEKPPVKIKLVEI
jgi:hypothetical protein